MSVDSPQPCRLVFEGVLTVRNIQTAYDRLSAMIAQHQTIEVDCDGVVEFDLSLMQLLLAAKRGADKDGKSLRLTAPVTGKLRTALDRAGFLGARETESGISAAFWLKGLNAA